MSERGAPAAVKVRSTGAAPTLQRKCACGRGTSSLLGDCPDCEREKAKRIQKKVLVGSTEDPLEHEADRAAERVLALPPGFQAPRGRSLPPLHARPPKADSAPPPLRSTQDAGGVRSQGGRSSAAVAQAAAIAAPGQTGEARPIDAAGVAPRPANVHEPEPQVPPNEPLTQGGSPLDADLRGFFEARYGRDLSEVRIHTGLRSESLNDGLNAHAFTYGSHVWLGRGHRPRADFLMAHELAHVVQQTQPPTFPAPHRTAALSPSPRSVQRYEPYWVPAEFIAKSATASKAVGTPTHNVVLPSIGKLNQIYTEAPVPNANKTNGGHYDIVGIADLYDATTTVGVYFDKQKLPKELDSNPQLRHGGETLKDHGHIKKSAPRAVESTRSVIRTANAPAKILVGDLKPSHGTEEAKEGPQQLLNYHAGFRLAHDDVNKLDVGRGGYGQTDTKWPTLTTGILKVKIPDEFKVETGGSGQKSRALVQIQNGREVNAPAPVKKQRRQFVMGKVYVSHSPDPGILNYVWEPDTPDMAPKLPASVNDLGAEVESKLVKPILASPVTTKAKRKASLPIARRPAAPTVVQRKTRPTPPDAKDPFDQAAFETWKTDHELLTKKEKALETTADFGDAEAKALAVEDRKAAIRSGFKFRPISTAETAAAKTVHKMRFWTGFSSAIFGRLRYSFGGLFVKVVNAYHAIRARFHNLLKDKGGAPNKGGLLGTVVRIAFEVLKAAGQFLVHRTSDYLVDSLKTGVAKTLKSLIPEDKYEEFEAKVQEITKLATDLEQRALATVEAFVKATVGPYLGYIQTITDAADKLSELTSIVNKVKWGARVVACLSPPGWGCLWILAQSVMERFAAWLIDSCWFKKEITPLVTAADFITGLPRKLANFIIEGIRGFLPDALHDVFEQIGADTIKTDVPPDEICDKNDFPTRRDLALVEKLALDDLRKDIGEDKWNAWIKLGELYGVHRGAFLTEVEVHELKKELKKASLASLREAAEMFPVLAATTSGKDVVKLSTLIERVEELKQQMAGSGGQGSGGGDGSGDAEGISVTASKEKGTGDFKKKGFGFKVVAGVTRGQYPGDIIKVDKAATIRGIVVTLKGIEVRVVTRQLLPTAINPDRMVVVMKVTTEQVVDIEKEYGMEAVKKIGYKRFRLEKGATFDHTLQLKSSGQAKQVQRKLAAGPGNDPLEHEADRVANRVLAGPTHPGVRGVGTNVQRFSEPASSAALTAPASVDRVVSSPGSPLTAPLRRDMEERFGHDFSLVRVHSDAAAGQSAQEVNANAYTVGHHIAFGPGRFSPGSHEGRRLIAHELTHVLQQRGGATVLRRQVHGPKATATPTDWKEKVTKATAPADRAALIESLVSPVKVVDKTADAAKDAAVDPKHLIQWDSTSQTVAYDDGLNAKKGRGSSAGFTKEVTSGPSTAKTMQFYIVLGPKALDPKDATTTTVILNHEFDHVRGARAGSTLTGDESEIETWTSTFVREFHRSYAIRERSDGATSYVDPGYATFTQLGGYYARSTDATVKAAAVKKIADYYTATIKPHAVHDKVFRYWIHRGINAMSMGALCGDVNDKLGKIVDPAKDVKEYWEMPTAIVKAATFTGPPTVQVP
jgi:hypothetical protein